MVRYDSTPVALVHIIHLFQPFLQHKTNLSLESLYFLSYLERVLVAIKDLLGLQGHHSSCELSTNYGALVDLIESFESDSFLRCLDIYTIPSTTAMTEITRF